MEDPPAKRARVEEQGMARDERVEQEREDQHMGHAAVEEQGDAAVADDGVELYCVCRQPEDENRSMIGCEGCDGWCALACTLPCTHQIPPAACDFVLFVFICMELTKHTLAKPRPPAATTAL
jgi:hypothetical protein